MDANERREEAEAQRGERQAAEEAEQHRQSAISGREVGQGVAGIPVADALPSIQELDAMCQRQTGRALQEWDEHHVAQRSRALRRGRIRSDRPLNQRMVMEWSALYGFQPDDFQARMVSVSSVANFEQGFKRPVCRRTGNAAHTVIRWFLKPDRIPA